MTREQFERALSAPGCERLKELAAIGPVHRAALEEFADRIRAATIERAADIAKSFIDPEWPGDDLSVQAKNIESGIRALSAIGRVDLGGLM
jgi:hypothetical protein